MNTAIGLLQGGYLSPLFVGLIDYDGHYADVRKLMWSLKKKFRNSFDTISLQWCQMSIMAYRVTGNLIVCSTAC